MEMLIFYCLYFLDLFQLFHLASSYDLVLICFYASLFILLLWQNTEILKNQIFLCQPH